MPIQPPPFVRCARSLDFYAWVLRNFRGLDSNKRSYYTKLARVEFNSERSLRGQDRVRILHEKGVVQVAWLLKKYGIKSALLPWDTDASLESRKQ